MILKPISTLIEMPKLKGGAKEPVRKHKLVKKTITFDAYACQHGHLIVDLKLRKVRCSLCDKDIDPFEALEILCRKTWWDENRLEDQVEYEEKRVKKVQYAAVVALYEMNVTPEKYAEKWAAEHARRQALAATVSIKQEPAPKVFMEGGDKPPAA
jgi:hypothetical protein